MPGAAIRVEGLRELIRDLRRIDKELGRAATTHLRKIARETRDEAARRAPVGKRQKPARERLHRSYRYSVTQRGASVYTISPYGAVHEFGGTIKPRGVPITIPRRRMIYGAIDARREGIEEELGGLLDVIAATNGFRPDVQLKVGSR